MTQKPPSPDADGPAQGAGSNSDVSDRRRRRTERLTPVPPADSDEARLRREINVYEVELEHQNEELRRAHTQLDAARARYQDLYDAAPVALVTIGLQGRILTSNKRAVELLQRRGGVGRSRITDFMAPDTAAAFEAERRRVLQGDAPIAKELELRTLHRQIWVEMTMSLIRDETDGSLVCQVALRDITERKQLQEDVARLAAVVSSAQQAIVSETLSGIITSWNAAAEQLFGYTANEAIGHSIDMVIPRERQREEKALRAKRETHTHEGVRVRRDGTLVPVSVATAPIHDKEGRTIGISQIMQDITAQVEARREVQKLLADLREADHRKDTFIATLAHELRNPLAPIRNAAAVLRFAENLDPKLQWCRDVIDRQVTHMSALLEDLLDVSRLARDRISLRWDRVELGTAIVQAVEITRPLIEGRHHKLLLELPREPIEIEGDVNRLIQIFGNLLSNAAKYTEAGGEISVTAEERAEDVVVRVKDNGRGIAAEQLDGIFELFSQIDSTGQNPGEGLGIGLALVRGLVERHHGSITAHSDGLGKGSEFTVTLPAVEASRRMEHGNAAGTQQRVTPVGHSRRILVVDDNIDAAESMAIILRVDGHEVRTAHDGERAIEMAAEMQPHVILLDLGMPHLSGYDVARRIRSEPWGREIALVACTGWGQPEDRRRSKAAGFDQHLVKPVSPDTVAQLVASLTSAKQT